MDWYLTPEFLGYSATNNHKIDMELLLSPWQQHALSLLHSGEVMMKTKEVPDQTETVIQLNDSAWANQGRRRSSPQMGCKCHDA